MTKKSISPRIIIVLSPLNRKSDFLHYYRGFSRNSNVWNVENIINALKVILGALRRIDDNGRTLFCVLAKEMSFEIFLQLIAYSLIIIIIIIKTQAQICVYSKNTHTLYISER